ncbi:hypothetical protein RHMOL_Rhmol02G0182400 [Rhododendron molle]|uniref:Uncharacterized protein n=1 Tax=Rhododendron molle TaxID=49168 RepID=A0ACC0PSW5_RHOML|nr:hypothetical protein RHMOL_Rhmol02G0182400 [Rhododendron molle]
MAADIKAEEREAEEAQGPRVRAVDEAGTVARPKFSEETYTLPRPHLFVPLGFAGYRPPQQTDYDLELVLRDPKVHIANTWAEAEQRDIRGFGRPCSSLALYEGLPPRVRELVDTAGFREFIQTLTVPVRNDHAILVALGERWRDTSNTFHLPPGEMTVTPTDFAAITGLRVGGDPIPFDSGIHKDLAALEWFLGEVPKLWAYEVLRMHPPECKHPDLSTLPCALIWSKEHRGTKEGRGSLNAYRLYLDELRASQIEWNPWRNSGPEPSTWPGAGLSQPAGCFWSQPLVGNAYQRDHLARPLGVRARREVQEQAREAGAERRAAAEIQREGERRVRCKESRPVVGGPPELLWKVDVVDSQGNPAKVQLAPARVEPAAVTVQVPVEWVNEAIRRMLALENMVRRAASGFPLELRYLAPTAQPAQAAAPRRAQAQGRAASKKRARSPPRAPTTMPPAATRHTKSSQPATAGKEAARKAVARAEERYRIEMRNRSGQDEPARKKQLILSQPAEEEEEGGEEEEGEEEKARSGSDDTADDPNYLQDPTENLDDDDGGGDDDDDGSDTDWFGRSERR